MKQDDCCGVLPWGPGRPNWSVNPLWDVWENRKEDEAEHKETLIQEHREAVQATEVDDHGLSIDWEGKSPLDMWARLQV